MNTAEEIRKRYRDVISQQFERRFGRAPQITYFSF